MLIDRCWQFEPGSDHHHHHNGRPASRRSAQPQPPILPPSLLPEGRGRHQPLDHYRTVPIEQLAPRRAREQQQQSEADDVDPFEHSPLSAGNDDGAGVRSPPLPLPLPPPPPPQQRMDGPRLVSPAIRLGEVVPPLRFHPEGKSRAAMSAGVGVAPPPPPPPMTGAAIPVKEVLLPYSVSPPRPSVPMPMPLAHERDVERGEDDDHGPFGDDSQIFPGSDLF